jgi:4'-phosphopantetheinyl transferase EntD
VTAVADPLTVEEDLRRLTPTGAGVAACEVQSVFVRQLSAGERALVRTARPVRRAEFASGRSCAHRALSAIGADLDTIGRGGRCQPIWPAGVCGSISHAGGLAAAVAARITPSVIGIGLDVERVDRLVPELWPHVLTPSESARCRASTAPLASATAVFSAKEAAFKATFPLWGTEIEFLDAHTELEAGAGTVEIPSLGASVAVRQGETGAFVVSLAIVASPAPRSG